MQPETSAQYQDRFARAIREGKTADGFDEERLNVYIRLVHNNIHGFIDRCYTETPQYLDEDEWQSLKTGFIRDARPQTPYFQEIAGEFLKYCRLLPLSDSLLAIMDFEYTQLLAEVAKNPRSAPPNVADDFLCTLSPAAFLRHYRYDVSDELQEAETDLLIWRDKEDDVVYRVLEGFDALLLEELQNTLLSLSGLEKILARYMRAEEGWQEVLRQKWEDWLEQGILVAP